jgi:hypothetical protein
MIYASVVPPWQGPDEPPHFERAKAAFDSDDWTSTAEDGSAWYDDLAISLFTFNYFDYLDTSRKVYSPTTPINRYFPLYQEVYQGLYDNRVSYMIIGWPSLLAPHQEIIAQLYLIRLGTALMNVGIILLAYLTTKMIFPNNSFLALGVPILILFNPQHTHILSIVNNGNLTELLATAALFFMVRAVMKGFFWLDMLLVVIFSLAATWTKATAYFLPIILVVFALLYLWRYRRYWYWILPIGIVLVGSFFFWAPERLRYLVVDAGWMPQNRGFYLDPIVPQDLFRSFWAMPGWTIFQLHPLWYQLLLLSCILAVIGLIILVIRNRHVLVTEQYRARVQILTLFALAIVIAIGIILSWNGLTNVIIYRQGRSIYPVIVPISIFLMLGWHQLIPRDWRRICLLAITMALLLFDTMVIFHYTIPFFYSRY